MMWCLVRVQEATGRKPGYGGGTRWGAAPGGGSTCQFLAEIQ